MRKQGLETVGSVTASAVNEKTHERGPLIDENVKVKICDLGNGCWTHFHFT